MKILQMGAYPPPHGGVQTNVVAIRRYLLERQIPCAVINLTRHRESCADQLYHPTNAWQVVTYLLCLPYDIVHLHHGGELTARLLALYLLCGLLPGKKAVLTCHSGGLASSPVGQNARYWSCLGFIFRRLDRIIVVNQEMIDMFRRYGVSTEQIKLILPFALHAPDEDEHLNGRPGDFFARCHPRLLTVGLLEPEYDLPLQIRVMERILEQHPRAGLMIIGSGSLEAELRVLIASKPYAEQILLCSDVDHDQTLCAIRDSDLFLRTTRYDGDAVSVREALHLGTPVIATDNGMRPAGVHCIPIGDPEALHHAMSLHLTQPVHRVCQETDGEDNLAAILHLYEDTLGHSEARQA